MPKPGSLKTHVNNKEAIFSADDLTTNVHRLD